MAVLVSPPIGDINPYKLLLFSRVQTISNLLHPNHRHILSREQSLGLEMILSRAEALLSTADMHRVEDHNQEDYEDDAKTDYGDWNDEVGTIIVRELEREEEEDRRRRDAAEQEVQLEN